MHSILVIDDDPKIGDIYRRYLEVEEFNLYEAEDWERASLFFSAAVPIDLILLDIRMLYPPDRSHENLPKVSKQLYDSKKCSKQPLTDTK